MSAKELLSSAWESFYDAKRLFYEVNDDEQATG